MTTKALLTIDYHSDTETGDVKVGEVDFGICGELDNYLEHYGIEGKNEIVKMLAFLIYEIERKFREQPSEKSKLCGLKE